MKNKNADVLLALVKVGLWADVESVDLKNHGFSEQVDWELVYQLAGVQSIIGLIIAGIERLRNANANLNFNQEVFLQMIGEVQTLEQTNKAMNKFIEKLVGEMREADIYTLLVKGQGIAQCYEKPLWRVSGDVDLLLSEENYQKAKEYLVPLSTIQKSEDRYSKHLGLKIPDPLQDQTDINQTEPWYVELHGTLRSGLAAKVDELADAIQRDIFYGGNVRSWNNGGTTVFLPAPNIDAISVFSHFLMHFYRGDMTLSQICDWSRLLWTYRDEIDVRLLERRLCGAGLLSEWKAFGAMAVEYLGMPMEAMPLYSSEKKWKKKGRRILNFLLKGCSGKRVVDTITIAKIFPYKVLRYSPSIFLNVNWLKIKERMFIK